MGVELCQTRFPKGPLSGGRRFGLSLLAGLLLAACGASPEAMVGSAKDYLAKHELDAASIQLKNALQENPDLGEARYLLGVVNLEQGDGGGAVKNLRRAIEAGYQSDAVWGSLARAMLAAGDGDGLLKEFAGKTITDPAQKAHVLAALGEVRLAMGQRQESEQDYQAALASDPNNIRAHLGVARLKAAAGDLPGAIAELEPTLALPASPDQADVYGLKASLLLAQQKPDEAVAALEGAIKLKPGAVGPHFGLVSLLLRQNRPEQAKERLDAMKKAVGKHPSALYLQAFMDFREGRLKEARDSIEQVIRGVPDFLPGRLLAGSIYLRLNEQQQAQANLQKVLERVPGQPLARRMLVASLLATKDVVRAEDALKPLLESGKNDPTVLGLAGQLYLSKGDFDRSADYFERVVHADPKNVQAMTRLGVAKLAGGETQDAFEDLEAASKLDEGSVQADIALIMAHLRRNELDQALAAQQVLERKQPDNPQTYNLKGGVLLAKRDLSGAKAAFEKALSLQPTFIPAVVNLARIDMAEKHPEDAKKRFEAVIAKDPKMIQAYLGLAELQTATGSSPADIETTLKRAIAASPTDSTPKLALVRFYLRINETKKALALAQEAQAAAPEDPATVELLGRAQMAAGDTQQGLASFAKLAKLQPGLPGPLVEQADALAVTKNFAGAEQSLKKALELKADFLPAQQRLIAVRLRDKREVEALAVARDVQRQRPTAPIGYALEGDIRAASQNWVESAGAFRKALERAKTADVAIKLHAVLGRAGKQVEADRVAEDWLKSQPKDLQFRGYLAERAMGAGQFGEAVKQYEAIQKAAPENPMVLNNLAFAAGRQKDPRAIGFAEQALKLAPNNPAILDTLGMLEVEKGDLQQGIARLEKARELSPKALAIRLNLAEAYGKAGKKPEARKEVESVLQESNLPPAVKSRAENLLKGL